MEKLIGIIISTSSLTGHRNRITVLRGLTHRRNGDGSGVVGAGWQAAIGILETTRVDGQSPAVGGASLAVCGWLQDRGVVAGRRADVLEGKEIMFKPLQMGMSNEKLQ